VLKQNNLIKLTTERPNWQGPGERNAPIKNSSAQGQNQDHGGVREIEEKEKVMKADQKQRKEEGQT